MKPSMPSYTELRPYYEKIFASRWMSNFGPVAEQLELKLAARLQVKHCLVLSNLSTGLMFMPGAAGLTAGEVIVPSFTFLATAHSMKLAGLTPVFADVDPETLTLDPRSVSAAIGPNTVAVCGVHVYGTPCDIEGLESVCNRHGLVLFFDSAHGLGSFHNGRPLGGFGLAEGFSTSVTKPLTTLGEGGFLCTNDDSFAEYIRLARNWGHGGDYNSKFASIVSKMPEVSAAAGLIELERLDTYVANRGKYVAQLKSDLQNLPGLTFPKLRKGDESSWKDFSILVDQIQFGLTRDQFQIALAAEGIESRKYFAPCIHQTDAYSGTEGCRRVSLENSESAAERVICLPLHNQMEDDVLNRLYTVVRRIQEAGQKIATQLIE
jgi:dTDP-4-amino-4,6-dideoxygalactose transaminase